MLARIARCRALQGIAADLRSQFHEIDEHVGLAAQFIRDHRWLARNRRNHGDADTTALPGYHQRTEIAVARKQHDLIDMLGEFHGIDREFDVHVALHLAAARSVMNSLAALVTNVYPL